MSIEISLCERDHNGNKVAGRKLISVGNGPGCQTTLANAARMVGDHLTKGKRGQQKRLAVDEVFNETKNP